MTSPTELHGSCYCKSVQFTITLPSRFCANCHCVNCRKAHGAAFVTWLGVPDHQFRITQGQDQLSHYKTETEATRSFCRICGSTLLFKSPRWEGEIHIALANVDGNPDKTPYAHVYYDQRVSWFDHEEPKKYFGGKSGMEPL